MKKWNKPKLMWFFSHFTGRKLFGQITWKCNELNVLFYKWSTLQFETIELYLSSIKRTEIPQK